jgi:hypothetical protein
MESPLPGEVTIGFGATATFAVVVVVVVTVVVVAVWAKAAEAKTQLAPAMLSNPNACVGLSIITTILLLYTDV